MSDDIHAERRIHQLEEQLRNARDDALEEAAEAIKVAVYMLNIVPHESTVRKERRVCGEVVAQAVAEILALKGTPT